MTKPTAEKEIIGWSEYIDFPDWEIRGLKAKIDTGARTSALHVEDVEEDGDGWVNFHVVLDREKDPETVAARARVLRRARVRSSTGESGERFFVKTRIRIGHVEKEIELTLVSRHNMLFRMLLGRKALEDDFLIDVNRRAVLGRRKRGSGVRKKQ